MSVTILALDTSTEACSVALESGDKKSFHYEYCSQQHTQRILPIIDKLIAENNISLSQLDVIAVCQGPGSFTGVRIGISVAQGLAFGLGIPIIPVSTLQVLAQGAYRQTGLNNIVCAIDARMKEVYWATYQYANQHWHLEGKEQVISPEVADNYLKQLKGDWGYAGTGFEAYSEQLLSCKKNVRLLDGKVPLPLAEDLLSLATNLWKDKQYVSPADIEPTYIRNEVTWKKLPGR